MTLNETQTQFDLLPDAAAPEHDKFLVRKRDGHLEPFNDARIALALESAFKAELGLPKDRTPPQDIAASVAYIASAVAQKALALAADGRELEVELIQDLVENELMRSGQHAIARAYILYREERKKARVLRGQAEAAALNVPALHCTLPDGSVEPLDVQQVRRKLIRACAGLADRTDWRELAEETLQNLYDGVTCEEIDKAMIFAAKARVEREPAYSFVAARLLLNIIYREVLPFGEADDNQNAATLSTRHAEHFADYLRHGVELGRLDSSLLHFDLPRLSAAMHPERDNQFTYMGLQTVYDRYLIHSAGRRLETPQYFWMRVSMGLAVLETAGQKNERAVEFYELLSSQRFTSSTPTLFNSGTLHPQLSSCYLSTVMDDLNHIFKVISDDAKLSKWAGGLGNDWTNIRSTGAMIRGTNGESQGVVPFLKVANDTAVAVNQCFAPGTKVWTARGVKAIETIRPGDLVLGIDAQYREVTEAMEYPQDDAMVAIRLKHTSGPIRVTAGHPLFAIQGVPLGSTVERAHAWFDKGKVTMGWVDAGKLRRGDYVAQVVPTEVVPVEGFTPEDARLYGLMLGDGHQTSHRYEWGLCFNHQTNAASMKFAENYLRGRGIPFHASQRGCYRQIKWSSARTNPALQLPFDHDDLYDENRKKRVSARLAHLPRAQTLQLLRGLIETDGNVSRGKEVTFSNTSEGLMESVRYQLLRLGVPAAATARTRQYERESLRSDGSAVTFSGVSTEWVVRVPAVPELAAVLGCRALTKFNWLRVGNFVFTRVRSVEPMTGVPLVYDLKVEGVESYTTTAALVHNGGKRKGAMCAYLETWHLDIEDFLELRKNTGDERRRTHDMNTANWIPDLFMKRVAQNGMWTLFNPSDCPDLHDLYGRAFEARYVEYEAMAERGEMPLHRRVEAVGLWRKMLTMLFETGHPWLTFKDPSNICSPQDHAGVVHSSNLCCMTADQRVVTAEGLLTVEELYGRATPNTVLGRSGPVPAGPMLLPRPDAPIVRILTREGYEHKVTPDHKVWVVDRGWVEARDLQKGDLLEIQQTEGLWGRQSRQDEAFLCGLIAGDGTFGRNEKTRQVHIDLWANEFDLVPEVEERVARVLANPAHAVTCATTATAQPRFQGDEYKRRLTSTPLARVLLELGFRAETKHRVPDFVWKGDRATVCQYLRGLYLADATTQAQELGVTTCALASSRREFLHEIQLLLANLGVKSTLSKMRDAGPCLLPDGQGGEKEFIQAALWRLLVTSIQGCQVLEEATGIGAARRNGPYLANLQKTGYAQKRWATFEGLEILPNEDAYCLQVFTDEHSWTVNGLITKNTEILLNTSEDEIAVCNLGSINLAAHTGEDGIDAALLDSTVRTAMRMLDNVIDINYYPTPEARHANLRHRPVGLGLMGFQDALYKLGIPYASAAAVDFADRSMELISYHAILASTDLARERGTYLTYPGSKWSRGILPMDTPALVEEERGGFMETDRSSTLDWEKVRAAIRAHGMRNSNTMAIAPTATISNISGVSQSIEPMYKHLFAKSNLSGEFTTINVYLIEALKKLDLWDPEMVEDLKYYDGVLTEIERIPDDVKEIFRTAFEIEPRWLIECASRRQKWIDMGQSLNLYLAAPNGKKLSDMYTLAWRKGLKTTYYLRTLAATQIEKSTVDVNRRGAQPRWMKNKSASANVKVERQAAPAPAPVPAPAPAVVAAGASALPGEGSPDAADAEPASAQMCSLLDPTCEACQ